MVFGIFFFRMLCLVSYTLITYALLLACEDSRRESAAVVVSSLQSLEIERDLWEICCPELRAELSLSTTTQLCAILRGDQAKRQHT